MKKALITGITDGIRLTYEDFLRGGARTGNGGEA